MASRNMNQDKTPPPSLSVIRFFALAIISIALISGLPACVTENKQDKALMQTQLTRIDERVGTIHKSVKIQANIAANVAELESSVMALNGQVEEFNIRSGRLMKKLERLERAVSNLAREANKRPASASSNVGSRLGKMEEQLGKISKETEALSSLVREQGSRPSVAPPEPKREEKRLEPGELYQLSYNSYLRADYDAAMSGFGRYLKLYPETDLSDNAAYWIGESHINKNEYVLAANAFDQMAKSYPTSNKAPTALLKSADAFLKVDDKGAAVVRLKILVDKYTSSNEAITATDRLSSLGIQYPGQ